MASDDFLQVLAGASLISLEDSPQLLRASMLSRFAAARMVRGRRPPGTGACWRMRAAARAHRYLSPTQRLLLV